ncbi:MAG TPA: exo-alpha-sialidase [Blastocatellia bacterium]|nr:exo-alpha-sialidase [Blastocatellia bacterium]
MHKVVGGVVLALVLSWVAAAPAASVTQTPLQQGPHDRAPRGAGKPPARPAAPPPAATRQADVSEPVRASTDLLLSDAAGAQPGTQAEPYLAADPADPSHLVAGWQENRFATGGARALTYAVSTDGGRTWTDGLLPNSTTPSGGPWQRSTDPWVEFGPEKRVYYAGLLYNTSNPDNAMSVSVSTDGGATWGSPVKVFRSTNGDFNDKEALAVDTFPSSPHYGNVYVAWDVNKAGGQPFSAQHAVIARSTDGGKSYSAPKVLRKKGTNIGLLPRVGPDGTVYMVWEGNKKFGPSPEGFYFSKSTNGGHKWSKPRQIVNLDRAGVPGLRTGEFVPSFAVDRSSGALYVAWQDGRWTGTAQATLIVSRDGGTTWSEPTRVSDGPGDAAAFTVAVATNARGDVGVSYYSLRNDPDRDWLTDVYLQVSRDGGRTFEPARRITESSFDVRFTARAGDAYFPGDYAGLVGTSTSFHMLWVGVGPRPGTAVTAQPDVFSAPATE